MTPDPLVAPVVGGTPEQLIERLESYYAFECEGGPLKNCVEWQQLKAALVLRPEPREPVVEAGSLRDLVRALREKTWLSPMSASELNYRDRWLANVIEGHLDAAVRPASAPSLDYVQALKAAKAIVNASVLYKKFIDGTPLENDIAVWMADFVFAQHEAASAPSRPLEELIAEMRDRANYDFNMTQRAKELILSWIERLRVLVPGGDPLKE